MSEPASISAGIAGRYATAVFELVKEAKGLKALEADVGALEGAVKDSADLRALISSPIYTRDQQTRAIGALAAATRPSLRSYRLRLRAGCCHAHRVSRGNRAAPDRWRRTLR